MNLKDLDIILEDSPTTINEISQANDLAKELEAKRLEVLSLENKLSIISKKICGELAIYLRRKNPSLNIGAYRDYCKIGYKSKSLKIKPDLSRGIWIIGSKSNSFANSFMKKYSSKTSLDPDVDKISNAIINHFSDHYKSLREDVEPGLILIEDRKGSLVDLIRFISND